MFNPFKVFYWGVATVLKLMVIGVMYLCALACVVYGFVSIIHVGQFFFGFADMLWGDKEIVVLLVTFGGGALYIALLGGAASIFFTIAGKFIAWAFRKDVSNVLDLVR